MANAQSLARLEARLAACRAIEETEILRPSLEDQRRVSEAILTPEPVPALHRAFRRHRDLFGGA